MRVTDLIEQLLKMPQEAEVELITYDSNMYGYNTAEVDGIYLSKLDRVLIHKSIDFGDVSPADQPNPIQP